MRGVHHGLAMPCVGAPLCSWELRSVQDEHRLQWHDAQLLARRPDVPPGLHEQSTVPTRQQRADLQHEHGGLRRLQLDSRLSYIAEHLRSNDAAMRAVL